MRGTRSGCAAMFGITSRTRAGIRTPSEFDYFRRTVDNLGAVNGDGGAIRPNHRGGEPQRRHSSVADWLRATT